MLLSKLEPTTHGVKITLVAPATRCVASGEGRRGRGSELVRPEGVGASQAPVVLVFVAATQMSSPVVGLALDVRRERRRVLEAPDQRPARQATQRQRAARQVGGKLRRRARQRRARLLAPRDEEAAVERRQLR